MLFRHYKNVGQTKLRSLIPEIGNLYTPLHLCQAFEIYNSKYHVTKRRYVPPTTHEIRHIINIAQVVASRGLLNMVTFDGDETLYSHGQNLDDLFICKHITSLLRVGIMVALVTAAAYGYQTEKYSVRVQGLLDYMKKEQLGPEVVKNFFIFGGECNYLLRCGSDYNLEPVPEEEWLHFSTVAGRTEEITQLLDVAEKALEDARAELHLRVKIVRKERAVGMVPGGAHLRKVVPQGSGGESLKSEILEEVVCRIKDSIRHAQTNFPYCAFNGGKDVWVDVGNKAEGIRILQKYGNLQPMHCIHVGDQFSASGNDVSARNASPTIWVCNPCETKAILRALNRQLKIAKRVGRAEHMDAEQLSMDVTEADIRVAMTDCEDGENESLSPRKSPYEESTQKPILEFKEE
eukprot:GHVP01032599.1.p1 GENE.GHVP01032599.1~~GHVP01032599.1.p1  ORF type:complete len:405 (+),score=52.96 GHVP01032599.1:440-1654(+)